MVIALVVLSAIAIRCAVGWISQWVGTAALAEYMQRKGIHAPSDKELEACTEYVWNHLLHRR